MWPILRGEKSHEYDEIVLNIDEIRNMSALRKGDWKIIAGWLNNVPIIANNTSNSKVKKKYTDEY